MTLPSIFNATLGVAAFTLVLSTLFGRALTTLLPRAQQGLARFYLAPALGLAALVAIASVMGRFLPLRDTRLLVPLILGLLILCLWREPRRLRALGHVALVCAFGLVCGAPVLAALLMTGTLDTNNDTFTYLAHAQWLQHHAFSATLVREQIVPLEAQVLTYQGGLRMGASYLLAMIMALLRMQWAMEAYPAMLVSAVTACCLAPGFALARLLRRLPRIARLALLALPAMTVGGLMFGAARGFLPQTVGLACGGALLYLAGPTLQWATRAQPSAKVLAKAAVPAALLLWSATLAYMEMSAFLLLALGLALCIGALRSKTWRAPLSYGLATLSLACLCLNTDIVRDITVLRYQASVLVGTPVDWSLLGFLAHAFGVHGGPWAAYQWSAPGVDGIAGGLILLAAAFAVLVLGARRAWRQAVAGPLLPVTLMLAIFALALLYYRYGVPTPFPSGTGQSWSQAKLAGWAHPFVLALVAGAAALLWRGAARWVLSLVLLTALGLSVQTGWQSVASFTNSFGPVRDMEGAYKQVRAAVANQCNPGAPVFIAVEGKTMEMLLLYLADKPVQADFASDNYFYELPAERSRKAARAGDCVVTRMKQDESGAAAFPFQVQMFGAMALGKVEGAHTREMDGGSWWHWVEREAHVNIEAGTQAPTTLLRFDYESLVDQTLTVHIERADGSVEERSIPAKAKRLTPFETRIEAGSAPLSKLSFTGDGKAQRLGPSDPRMGSYMLRNLRLAAAP